MSSFQQCNLHEKEAQQGLRNSTAAPWRQSSITAHAEGKNGEHLGVEGTSVRPWQPNKFMSTQTVGLTEPNNTSDKFKKKKERINTSEQQRHKETQNST